jgi:hypothetical protein
MPLVEETPRTFRWLGCSLKRLAVDALKIESRVA